MISTDATQMSLFNVTDTCAVWNILSSIRLYNATKDAGMTFAITSFILYECLHKERQVINQNDEDLKARLVGEREKGKFRELKTISIEDLQQLDIIQNRKRLSKGELTAIAFVRNYAHAGFLTDDRGARRMAEKVIVEDRIRTTPLLLGWLFYHEYLNGSDIDIISEEHRSVIKSEKSDLSKFFYEMFTWALQKKLVDQGSTR